ncbi:MATE family efflux transporter [Nonomuraea sp. SYSU D8015]|uniref:MATE family efflux transporter n=1 Tax=Nonomuraea sp. SYSU D8015 TaxID=2593644 RepID=UPI0016602A85|nr:MATE family efflux transporter [Nonomuraea sp. SYSU D8015]
MRKVTTTRELTALAVPLALTQLAQVALTTTDTVMLGLLGVEALAAGGLAMVIFNQFRTMGVGLVTAVGNQVAAAHARQEDLGDLIRAALALATVAGVGGAVLMVAVGEGVGLLGQDPVVIDGMRPMLWALAPGLVPCLWFQAIRQFTVGMRRPQALLRITLASIVVNGVLNAALMGPFGLAGIGLATSSVYLLTFLALYASARRDPELAPMLDLRAWRARPATLRGLTGLGVPIAATYGSEAGFFSLVALLVGTFGTAALAAHTAVNQLVYIVFQISVGLSHAASIGVSREVALGDPQRARRIARAALACGAIAMGVVGLVYLALPELVLRAFLEAGDGTATGIATSLLMVAAVMQFVDCAQNIGVGLLRGLDDTKGGFRVTLVGYWLVGLPAVWLLSVPAGLDTLGTWLGLFTGLAATAALLLTRFHRALSALQKE